MTGIEIFETLITCLSPIIIAIIGYMQVRRDKSDKKYRELREQYDREKEAQAAKEKEEADKALEDIKKSIANMSAEIAELKALNEKNNINKELGRLIELTKLNYDYSHSISNLVTSIATDLQKSENIQHEEIDVALAKHRETTHELSTKLYKALY